MKKGLAMWIGLTAINFVYACSSVFSKMASREAWLSSAWCLWMAGAVGVMGMYALLWQQALARVPVSMAYMFRGMSLIFVLALSAWLFDETITGKNIAGAMLIVTGIAMYSRA